MPKILTGKVFSFKTPKTVIIEVEFSHSHPLYKKVVRKTKKYKVHNENLTVEIGDKVKIRETRPISKDKRFKLIEVLGVKAAKSKTLKD